LVSATVAPTAIATTAAAATAAADTSAADVVGSAAAAAVAVAVAIASPNAIAAADAAPDVVAAARDTPGAAPLTAVDGGMVRVRWQTDSFVAIFSTETKPSAEIYGLFSEDYEHMIKFGSSLHGELFCNGVRLLRHGDLPHADPLPQGLIPRHVSGMTDHGFRWTLRDATPGEVVSTFPELETNLVITDGCGCQVTALN
jgi:hypothetical protein